MITIWLPCHARSLSSGPGTMNVTLFGKVHVNARLMDLSQASVGWGMIYPWKMNAAKSLRRCWDKAPKSAELPQQPQDGARNRCVFFVSKKSLLADAKKRQKNPENILLYLFDFVCILLSPTYGQYRSVSFVQAKERNLKEDVCSNALSDTVQCAPTRFNWFTNGQISRVGRKEERRIQKTSTVL